MQKVTEYDLEEPQSHIADHPTAPRERATDHLQSEDSRKTIIQVQQPTLSSSSRLLLN